MAVANTWAATGHSAPIHQPRLSSLSSSASASASASSSSSSSSSPSSSTISFSDHGFLGKNKKSAAVRVPRRVLSLRNQKNSRFYCLCTSNSNSDSDNSFSINFSSNGDGSVSSASEWDWNRWTRHFAEIEQADSYASVLKFQLEDAVEKEDFEEAAKLKTAITEATSKDSISAITSQLKDAINEERYQDASKLCRDTGSGLVGWWVGYSKDSDDPFGRIVRVTPGMGRFIGKTYSPRQLITASPGTPLFEIFVVKDADENYTMQVVFLQRVKSNSSSSSSSDSKLTKSLSAVELDNASVVEMEVSEKEGEKSDEKNIDIEEAAEEGINKVINFLKDKIPELKVKVMKLNVAEEVAEESDSVEQFMEDDKETTMSSDNEEASNLEGMKSEQSDAEGDSDSNDDEKDLDTKLFLGGVLHSKDESSSKDEHVRIPAEIRDIEKDSFVLHIPKRIKDNDAEENIASKIRIAAVAAQGVSELMPPEVAKAFWSSDKVSPKVSRDVREIVKLAVSQAQKRNKLSKYTNFSRITTSKGGLDPFDGLYVGAFGPYGTEVVQLRRKYGNWNVDDAEKSSDVEFFEYVEAVKLTGDLNVPAGQVTFRAKIGKGSRLTSRGMYPDELGVVAGYKGQGRIAEFGFRNPKWVEGELLQLNGKGMSPYVRGADLGFLYVVPEQSFLVLFNRLKLPE